MTALLQALHTVPDYLIWLFQGPNRYYAIGAAVFFAVVLLFSGRFFTVLRDLYVLAAVVLGVICYFRRQYPMFWICAASLAVLALFRLLLFTVVTITSTRRRRRIERTALEKAEKRRGSWEESQGYSGDRPIERDWAERAKLDQPEDGSSEEAASGTADTFTREQAISAAHKLRDLKDLGILTDEEFDQIKARLYARLG